MEKVVEKVEEETKKSLAAAEEAVKKTQAKVEKALPLKPNACFVIRAIGEDDKPSDLVLQMDPNDAYAPRRSGVHNVNLGKRVTEAGTPAYKA